MKAEVSEKCNKVITNISAKFSSPPQGNNNMRNTHLHWSWVEQLLCILITQKVKLQLQCIKVISQLFLACMLVIIILRRA